MGLANNQEEIGKPENFKHSISQRIVCYADYLSQEIKDDEEGEELFKRFLIAVLCIQDDCVSFPEDDLLCEIAKSLLSQIQKYNNDIIVKKLECLKESKDVSDIVKVKTVDVNRIYNSLFKDIKLGKELKKFKGTDIKNFKKALPKFTYETANEDTAKDVHISKTSYEHLAEDEKETSLQKIIFGNLILNLFNFNSKPKKKHMKIHIFPDNIKNKEPKCVTMDENKIPLKDDNQFCLKELSEFFSSLYDCINFTQTKPNSPPEPSPKPSPPEFHPNNARATSSTNTNGENLKII